MGQMKGMKLSFSLLLLRIARGSLWGLQVSNSKTVFNLNQLATVYYTLFSITSMFLKYVKLYNMIRSYSFFFFFCHRNKNKK